MIDSPIATKWLADSDNYDRKGANIRAIICHMAEGGGTDTYLANTSGNSSHYVVKYDGTVVQMIRENRAAGSLNPSKTRNDDDKPYTFNGEVITYGHTALRAALGAQGMADPNRYVLAIETEGFAKAGPNSVQTVTLYNLVNDIRRRYGQMRVLGHRDQQNYKACPGHHFPWNVLGGHGVLTAYNPSNPPMNGDLSVDAFDIAANNAWVRVPTSTWLYDNNSLNPSSNNVEVSPGRDMPMVGRGKGWIAVNYVDENGVVKQELTLFIAPK